MLDGDPALPPPKKGGHSPLQFAAHFYCGQTAVRVRNVYCGQTAEWINMPLGMEVGLSLGDIVLDGDPAPQKKKVTVPTHPIFGPCLLWPNSWMDEDATWCRSRPQPRPHCVRREPSSPPRNFGERGTAAPLLFGPCLLCPRSPISATAELLLDLLSSSLHT